ncbi:MAG: hypothetical protein IPO32_00925 [Crocinitomicaceae bacterium]|nr:hypothetical protein [Crocinitomicaceae bacterium]
MVQSQMIAQKDYARTIMDSLCSPHYDGRGYVNNGDVRAADFIIAELKKLVHNRSKNFHLISRIN